MIMSVNQTNILTKKNNVHFWLQIAFFILPFIIYFNTIGHGYALDDAMVITHNQYTKKGLAGLKDIFLNDSFKGFYQEKTVYLPGGRYRPLSIATFAVEKEFFGLNPHISHLVNILIYAFTGLLLFRLLRLLAYEKNITPKHLYFAAFSVLIFMVHPVHTEAVANIKGRDELLALLFALITLQSVIRYIDTKGLLWLFIGFISFLIALFSKENAIVFIVLAPLTAYFFRKPDFRHVVISLLPLILATLIIFIIRISINGGFIKVEASGHLMNNPYLHAHPGQKYATIVLTLGIYLKLLFWPHPLTFDYYPYHIALTNWHDIRVIVIFLLYIGLIFYAIIKFSNKSVFAYSILFFIICLMPVSNVFINVGTFMNERFVYQASVGFAIGISGLLVNFFETMRQSLLKRLLIASVLIIVSVFSVLTFSRNYAWKNDFTLFLTDVKTSSNSAKGNYAAGAILVDSALNISDQAEKNRFLLLAVEYLKKASEIDSTFSDVWRRLGTASYELNHNVPQAFRYYYNAIRNNMGDEAAYNHIYYILSNYDSADHKIAMYQELLQINPRRPEIYTKLGMIYGKEKNNYPVAIEYYKRAISLNHSYLEAYKGLGLSYALSGNFEEAFHWLEEAVEINPSDAGIYQIMGFVAKKKGDQEKANLYFLKARQLKDK